jgi:hypothetical protein
MMGNATAQVNGRIAVLVDLSIVGAQVVSSAALKPNQRVGVALPNDTGGVRFEASVVWTSFEIQPKSGPRYRAGLDFSDAAADAEAIGAFCERYKT